MLLITYRNTHKVVTQKLRGILCGALSRKISDDGSAYMLLCGLLFADKSFKNYLLSHVETFLLL